ncbi:MAG: LysR family transcriptional regulator [Acidobacteria bacterium]|nr:LysR family transcriptional regulator [Acidobacteriota bacterium]
MSVSLPPFELRQLHYFLALAEELHFSRAAQRVFISQPALSQQIGRLERGLGVKLFERDRHTVRLTDAGRAFMEGAAATLAAARVAASGLAGQTPGLRIGYREYGFSSIVLPAFTRLQRAHPRARLDRLDLGIGQLIPALLERRIDVGIGLLPFDDARIESQRIASGHWVAVLPRAHRLARRRSKVAARDLRGERLIVFQRSLNPAVYDRLLHQLREAGVAPSGERPQETAQVQVGPALVAEGLGIFLVASYALPPLSAAVTARPMEGLGQALEVGACWRAGETNVLLGEFRRALTTSTRKPPGA